MQIHQIKPKNKNKKSKRVARGGKRGTYSGKGMKGQKSRAGRKLEPPIRGIIKKYHKLRGYNFNSYKDKMKIVSLDVLQEKFKDNEIVSPKILFQKKIIRKDKGKLPLVKILKKGSIRKPLEIRNCFISDSARIEIEKAKGIIKD